MIHLAQREINTIRIQNNNFSEFVKTLNLTASYINLIIGKEINVYNKSRVRIKTKQQAMVSYIYIQCTTMYT